MLESVIRLAKQMYSNDTIMAAGSGTRKLWVIINEVIDRKQTKHSFKINDETVDTKKGISNGFNNYFASIGKFNA